MGSLLTIVKRSFTSFGSDQCSTLAAAIAYNTVFAIFPLALVGVAILGFIVGDGAARQNVVDGITKIIPLGDTGAQALSKTLAGASNAKGIVGIIGILTAAWSASGLFGNIRNALDSVWDVDRHLPMLRGKVRDLTLCFGFGGLLAVSIASTGILQGAWKAGTSNGFLGSLVSLAGPLYWLLTLAVPFAITLAAFMFLYKQAPHARLGWGDVWPAALIAALFFQFGMNLLGLYISHMGGFNALAGTLGAAILLLVFIYYASQVILLGAEFAKHRMLVKSGALPATDPATNAPKVSLLEKVKGLAARQWVIEERHHEDDLPYHPGRMDPVGNAPTNTKEEILFNFRQSEEEAKKDAVNKQGSEIIPAAAIAMKPGGQPQGRQGASPDDGARSRQNGPVALGAWSQRLSEAAAQKPLPHEKAPGGAFLWRGIGYLIALVLSIVVNRREHKVKQAKQATAKAGTVVRVRRGRLHRLPH